MQLWPDGAAPPLHYSSLTWKFAPSKILYSPAPFASPSASGTMRKPTALHTEIPVTAQKRNCLGFGKGTLIWCLNMNKWKASASQWIKIVVYVENWKASLNSCMRLPAGFFMHVSDTDSSNNIDTGRGLPTLSECILHFHNYRVRFTIR